MRISEGHGFSRLAALAAEGNVVNAIEVASAAGYFGSGLASSMECTCEIHPVSGFISAAMR